MTRAAIGAATLARIEEDSTSLIVFVELQLDSGTERLHTGIGTIAWGGNSWEGAGDLASFDETSESVGLNPEPIRMGLSGLSTDITNMVFTEDYYRRGVLAYLGALNDDFTLVEDPGLISSHIINQLEMTMADPEQGDTVLLTGESELAIFDRTKLNRYTDKQLQTEYSGDLGLQYIDQVPDAKTVWRGNNNVRLGTGGGSNGGSVPSSVPFIPISFF